MRTLLLLFLFAAIHRITPQNNPVIPGEPPKSFTPALPLTEGYGAWGEKNTTGFAGGGIFYNGAYKYIRYGVQYGSFRRTVVRDEIWPKFHEMFLPEGSAFAGAGSRHAGLLFGTAGRGHEWLAYLAGSNIEINLRYRYGDTVRRSVSLGSRGMLRFGLTYQAEAEKERYIGFYTGVTFGKKWHARLHHVPGAESRLYVFNAPGQDKKNTQVTGKKNQERIPVKAMAKNEVVFSRAELLQQGIPLQYIMQLAGKKLNNNEFFILLKKIPPGPRGKLYRLYREKYK